MSRRQEREIELMDTTMKKLSGYPKVIQDYVEEYAGKQATTKFVYAGRMIEFCGWLKENGVNIYDNSCWSKIDKFMIKDYIKSKKIRTLKSGEKVPVKPKTLDDLRIALNKFFKYLVHIEMISINPMPSKDFLSGIISEDNTETHVNFMTPEEVIKVRDCIRRDSMYPKRDECMFILGCRTGLRAQALCDIELDDIDWENGILYSKEKRNKTVRSYLGPDSLRLIRECIEEREDFDIETEDMDCSKSLFLFWSGRYSKVDCHRQLGYTTMNRGVMRNILDKFTIKALHRKITLHDMRHTCGTTTYKQTGGNVKKTADKLHHSGYKYIKWYVNDDDEQQDDAIKMESVY